MELKHNCVRDILLFSEKNLELGDNLSWIPLSLEKYCEALSKYSYKDIAYTLYLLEEAGFIEAHISKFDGGIFNIYVYRLTYKGHEFIDTIKSNPVWKKLQESLSVIGSASLPVIQDLGTHFATEMLSHL